MSKAYVSVFHPSSVVVEISSPTAKFRAVADVTARLATPTTWPPDARHTREATQEDARRLLPVVKAVVAALEAVE